MKVRRLYLIALVALLVALEACAPRAAPTPAQGPLAPQEAPATPSPATPDTSPENASWAKVVSEAKKEGKVTAYTYNWVGDIGITIADTFKKKYGIKLEIVTGSGAVFLEKLKAEKRLGEMVADMTDGSSIHLKNMKLEGLLVSIADELPALREKDAWLMSPMVQDPKDKVVLTPYVNPYTPYLNYKQVNPKDEPKVWRDLLHLRWKGKMTLSEPNISAAFYSRVVPLLDKKIIDEDYIRALYKQDLRFTFSLPDDLTMVSRGERDLSIINSDIVAARFISDGAPIKSVDMKDGIVVGGGAWAAIKNGPHPNATKVLLNWLFSQEGQSELGKAQSMRLIRKDVADFRPEPLRASLTNPVLLTDEYSTEATKLFRDKWFDKVVGR